MKYWEVSEDITYTNNKEKNKIIASFENTGFVYKFNHDQERVIVPARVKIYKYQENTTNEKKLILHLIPLK